MALAVLPLLGACAISTPFPRLKEVSGEWTDNQVIVVVTHIVVDSNQRFEFDQQTRRVASLTACLATMECWAIQQEDKYLVTKHGH